MEFADFFTKATPFAPYPYQLRLAQAQRLPKLLIAPTGAGKTEAAVLAAWLWRRLHYPDDNVRSSVPRRLVYCLPMRTLVEQTRDRVQSWLRNLSLSERIGVTVLMGGEEPDEWYLRPEQERIIIGTQDMLLSRALNRGYASSPFHWPVEFGLLNNDCLWVLDEVQLMANGLPTSTQLQAFRQVEGAYGTCHTLWMSATLCREWLHTVDFPAPSADEALTLAQDDLDFPGLATRRNAPKTLHRLDSAEVARQVLKLHAPGTMTLVVVNTVGRAQTLYDKLERQKPDAELVLVHSRFRPPDRREKTERVIARPEEASPGRIVVATQAIEAGVDISAHVLVTELAPWTSLVQRFGRCNRYGEYSDGAVYWLDLPEKGAPPYEIADLSAARKRLIELEGGSVAPASLPQYEDEVTHQAVLRRRDLMGLFDTTADLSGGYLDVSRFVRGTDETDVYVFWRTWEGEPNVAQVAAPKRDELCSVPIGEIKDFLGSKGKGRQQAEAEEETDDEIEGPEGAGDKTSSAAGGQRRQAWRWSHLCGQWEPINAYQVYPGMTLLLHSNAGGYAPETGWDGESPAHVLSVPDADTGPLPEAIEGEHSNTDQKEWVTLRKHSLHVRDEARCIIGGLTDLKLSAEVESAIVTAAQRHDLGKAHPVFQDMLLSTLPEEEKVKYAREFWAKSARKGGKYSRLYFRHELGSALALQSSNVGLDGWASDLAAYLAAAHHGKARLALRSLPKARDQGPDRYYVLGFRLPGDDDDWKRENRLPAADLGDGVTTQEMLVDLAIARMGVSSNGERSWLDRALDMLERLGPFRLAYLEALVRAADVRASKAEQKEGSNSHG